jgi:alpha-1,3-mannosylglycoprotein beta-1,4-N-acetylglucosaminyltransferase A/B
MDTDNALSRWRTKQNLDYAFMMLYARNKGQFYLQLEDDVLSTPGFMSRVTGFIHEREQMSQNWVFLEFSALGFIGKLFRSSDLHTLASFFLMFHKDKPIDWLLDHFLFVKVCNPEQDMRQCAKDKETVRIRHKPSLFQHVGQHSSLKGKIQKLKDRDFKNNLPPPPFTNPPAHLSTSLEVYQRHTLDQLYLSRDIFWAMTPKKGDTIEFIFEKPTMLSKIVILSGNTQHPGDICSNVTVYGDQLSSSKEVLPVSPDRTSALVKLCEFDKKGQAVCDVPKETGPLAGLKLTFTEGAKAWVLIRQINLHTLRIAGR